MGSVLLLAMPVMAALLLLGPKVPPEYRAPMPAASTWCRRPCSVLAILAVIFGLKEIAQDGLGSIPALSIVAGLALGVAFVARQGSLAHPMIDLGPFRLRRFNAALAVNFLAVFVAVRLLPVRRPIPAAGHRAVSAAGGADLPPVVWLTKVETWLQFPTSRCEYWLCARWQGRDKPRATST